MTVMVRQVNIDREREELLAILNRNLQPLPHTRRFDWLYHRNPSGTGWAWLAYEENSKKTAGVVSVFPRPIWIGKEAKICGQVGNFAIERSYRTLGPAVMLQRATFQPVDQGAMTFCYDCPPHERGMSPFRRIGIPANCQIHRYAMLLKTDQYVMQRLRRRRLASVVSAVGNLLLTVRSYRNKPSGFEISFHTGRFNEEFTCLDQQLGALNVIRGRRTAEDLNWRYRDDPLQEYRVITARRAGELVGFVVFSVAGKIATIIDLLGLMTPDPRVDLLYAVVDHLRKEPVENLQAFTSETNGLRWIFKKTGLRYRSNSARVVAYAPPASLLSAFLRKDTAWCFNYADVSA